jgi:hypothetical protein
LTYIERTIYTTIWMLIARVSAPIVAPNLNYKPDVIRAALDKLIHNRLMWFDNDLHAVLQCPPFSALHTPHQVKAFGWERAYMCSIVDAPLSLLVYGPNTWLNVETVCPRSGEYLRFRVMLDDHFALKIDAPAQATQWRIWVPSSEDGALSLGPQGSRARMNAFHSEADFDIYRYYRPDEIGAMYTLEQAVYLSQCLLESLRKSLSGHH